jgi:L-arabinose isomerase
MIDIRNYEIWFITGSQHLYGEEILKQVEKDSKGIAKALDQSEKIVVKVVMKPVLTTPEEITKIFIEANSSSKCIGLVTWMHTFSPAKMWIAGLKILQKPFVHLHTQFNKDIPWSTIDMDFMNLNQSAHGGREFGFIGSRMRINRKVVVGHWQDEEVLDDLGVWVRAALAWSDSQRGKIARFGDNMREVAVTEGDKVSAQIAFGYSVNGYGVGDLVDYINQITDAEMSKLLSDLENQYEISKELKSKGKQREALKVQVKTELGLRAFLEEGNFTGFTTTFENLHGLDQLPGLAVQRLMADGYGFGAEGDWKTAALVRAMKVMSVGLKGGTSFMEDYTYHLEKGNMKVLGAHMLEVCASIAEDTPSLEIHPLSIGGKDDPARLVFNVPSGPAVNAAMLDLGNRFRMLVNPIEVVPPDGPLPKLPVARVLWIPQPNLKAAATAWILAGGPHHTSFSQAVTKKHLEDFAEIARIEYLIIDDNTKISEFKKEITWNEAYYHLSNGFG